MKVPGASGHWLQRTDAYLFMAPFELDADLAYRTVLVPLDGSVVSAGAVPTAVALARRFDAELHMVTVVGARESQDDVLTAVVESLNRQGMDDSLSVRVVEADDVADGIERAASELDRCLLCLSISGRGRVATAMFGSVAGEIVHRAAHPIVLVGPALIAEQQFVRPRTAGLLEVPRLVAGVDGSPQSEAVLPIAASWARALDMSMTILTVIEPVLTAADGGEARRRHGPDGDAEAYVAGLVERWSDAVADVSGHVHPDALSVAAGIRDHLIDHPAGLVAVSTHARTGRERLFAGSDAAKIVQLAIAPVLLVSHR